jgi:DNA-binding transcriptional MocR family regulator
LDSGARVVFVQPTIHNPTVATMSERRRRDIIAVAEQRDLLIVEDDVYGLVPEHRPPPIAALAPARTIYINSASKAVAPGLRVGWILAPGPLAQALGEARYSISGQLPSLGFEVARRWIENGTARELMLRTRAEAAARQRLGEERLQGLAVDADPAAFHLVLHLPEPWRREEFVAAALARGVRVAPVSAFIVGQIAAPHAVRVSLAAAPDQPALGRALDILRDLALAAKSGTRRELV